MNPLRLLPLLAALCFRLTAHAAPSAEPAPPAVSTRAVSTAPAPAPAEFVARVGDDWILAAGGSFWRRPSGADTWSPLPAPVAYVVPRDATGVADGADWLLVGGENSAAVTRLAFRDGILVAEPLPPLPAARAAAGAALLGRVLHVVGGRDAAGRATDTVFSLDLAAPDAAWTSSVPYPGGPVLRPAMASNFGELLVVSGGEAAQAWGYRAKPVDGFTETGWTKRKAPPAPGAVATLLPSSTAHFILLGDSSAHVFNAVLDAWFSIPGNPAPASGLIAANTPAGVRLLARDGGAELALELPRARHPLAWADYGAIGLYFVAMVAVGLLLSGKQETSAEFALGNRDVKWWAAGISMFATGASSISFMAIPALAFSSNLVWFFPGFLMIVGYFVTAYIIFPLLRKLEITSTYEYLDRRFNRGLRLLASAQCIVFQTFGRMSVIMVLPSLAISAFTGMDVTISVLLMGVLTTLYTAIGGFKAVIWTDVFQGVLMIAAPLFVIGYAVGGTQGGLAGSWDAAQSYGKLNLVITDWDLALPVVWIMVFGGILNLAATVGDQPVIQRVFSVPLDQVRRTALMSTICGIVISCFTFGMGIALFGFFQSHPDKLAPTTATDQIVPLFIVQHLPAGLCGLVIASIFAAAMSTLSSSMNSVATLVCEDFYKPLFPNSSDAARVRLMKAVSYGVGAIGTGVAVIMAKQEITSMFQVWNKVAALLGGGFVGIYILGVFTTRANSAGAIAGGLASIVVTTLVDRAGTIHWVHYGAFAVTTCIVVGYLVSIFTGGSRRDLAGLTAFTARDRASVPVDDAVAAGPALTKAPAA